MQATFSSPSATTLVTQGIQALNGSNKQRARELLTEAVGIDPQNEQAWLWLSGAVETDMERMRCLDRVLAINPHNQGAQLGRKMLGTQLAPAAAEPAAAPALEAAQPSIMSASTTVAARATSLRSITLPSAPAIAVDPPTLAPPSYDSVFLRDRFMLRQKIALAEKYYVWDENNQPILFVERPRYLLRGLFNLICALAMGTILFFLGLMAGTALPDGPVQAIFLVLYVLASVAMTMAVLFVLAKKRHITFYRDDSKQEQLLSVLQDRKFAPINITYTVTDAQGALIAKLRKNVLYDLFRKRWYCYGPDGAIVCVAKEDSILRSFLRRAFRQVGGAIGALVQPLLRTNFILLRGNVQIGVFNRKMTLLDRYVLDMSADTGRALDRRVALALGVLLDTAERR